MKKLLYSFLLLLALANPFTQAWIAGRYVVEDALEPADAVIPLRGEPEEQRVRLEEAVRLIGRRYAPLLLVSVEGRPFYGRSQRSLIEEYLEQKKFPTQQLRFCENTADSTAEEALAIRSCLLRMAARQVILVTSEYHTRRARAIFQRTLSPIGIVSRVHPAYNEEYWNRHWWRRRRWAKTFVRETAALIWNTIEHWSSLGRRALPTSVKPAAPAEP